MRRLLLWLLFALPFVAGGWPLWRHYVSPLPVKAARAARGPAVATVFATGWIEARERRLLRPARAGVLERLLAKEGDEVRAGAPLFMLRDTAREQRRESIQAELDAAAQDLAEGSAFRAAAQSRIAEAEVHEKWAASEVARARPLREQELLEARAFEQLVASQVAAEQRVRTLRDDFDHARAALMTRQRRAAAELETLHATERDDTVVAPFDGVVLQRFAEEGEAVDLQRDLLKFGDLRELIVEGEVDEEDIARVRTGQTALVRVAGDARTLLRGEVFELFPDSNRATRSFRARVRFPGAMFVAEGPAGLRGRLRTMEGRELVAGLSVELGIVVDQRDDALVVPRAALTSRGTVFVLADGRAQERPVAVGLMNFDRCEIQRGLEEGELVALDRLGELTAGRRVAPVLQEFALADESVRVATARTEQGALELEELGGGRVDPLAAGGPRATVLLFTRSDCPISNRYAPHVQRLIDQWTPRGVTFWLVYVDPEQTDEQVRQHVADYGYRARIGLDRAHAFVRRCGAKVTPEAALFGADGRLAYCGRIDDRFVDLGVARAEPTERDLERALEAVVDGRAPPVARTAGVGCIIEDLR